MKKWALGILLNLGVGIVTPVYAADLLEVFQQALQSDPTFKAADAARLSDSQNVPIARAFLLPTAVATAHSEYNVLTSRSTPLVSSAFSNVGRGTFKYNSHGYALNLIQPIFDVTAWATYNQAKTTVKAADATYAAAAQNLMSRVASAYFSVLNAEDDLRYIQAEKRSVYRQLTQVREQFKVGLVAITGVYQAQAQYDSIVAEEIAAKNNIVNARENLRAITGIYYNDLAGLKQYIPLLTPDPANPEKWVETAREQNWTLRSARYTAQFAREEIGIQQAGHLPTLNAVARHERTKTGTTTAGKINNDTSMVGLELELPIFQGFFVVASTKQAQYDYQLAVDQAEETYRSVMNLTYQSYNNITAGVSKIKADRQAIVSNESSLRSTIESYKVGTETMLDVLQAQTDLFDAQRIYATDQYAYINATVALKEAAGTLNYSDFVEINSWLTESKQSYHAIRANQLDRVGSLVDTDNNGQAPTTPANSSSSSGSSNTSQSGSKQTIKPPPVSLNKETDSANQAKATDKANNSDQASS